MLFCPSSTIVIPLAPVDGLKSRLAELVAGLLLSDLRPVFAATPAGLALCKFETTAAIEAMTPGSLAGLVLGFAVSAAVIACSTAVKPGSVAIDAMTSARETASG